jgi:hypothetical protein
MRFTWAAASLLSICTVLTGQNQNRAAVLPLEQARSIPQLTAHDKINRHTGRTLSKPEIDALEADLPQVSKLDAPNWSSKVHIEHPENYYRQYIGIFWDKQPAIYINALCDDPPPTDWKARIYMVADGATCFWQAVYVPATRQFVLFSINGRA